MLNDISTFFSAFWLIFSFSFLVALTGAMAPGPLLTYTIIKSVGTNRRGYLMGLWIIIGHALLEMGIILFLLLGFSYILKNIIVVRIIGALGGLILIFFGCSIIRDVIVGRISTRFFDPGEENSTGPHETDNRGLKNPIIGGITVSMSNPYWWVWWATIGLAFIVQFDISFQQWPKLLAFFLGHEAGDLIWYLIVSSLAYFGMRHMNKKVYYGVLVICGIFMILFGIYLGISLFFKSSV